MLLRGIKINKAIFIDRDDTINKDVPYCSHPDEFELLPKVAEGIKLLNEHDFKVVVATNQSGIARGYFTEEMLERIHKKMKKELAKKGAFIDAIYYCPHHPNANCSCRKPEPGLLKQAKRDLDIDLNQSFVVGDRIEDVEAGKKVGSKGILVLTGEKNELRKRKSDIEPDYICKDLLEAARWIVNFLHD